MNAHSRDCVVENYEHLVEGLTLPDPDDRHVLAAAIAGEASRIVTMNLKDFPADYLTTFEIVAQQPGGFLVDCLERDPERVYRSLKSQRETLKRPPMRSGEFLAMLRRQGLSGFVDRLLPDADLL